MKKLLVSEIQKMSTNEIINLMSKENLEVLDNMVVDNIDFNREIFADDYKEYNDITRNANSEAETVEEYFKWYLNDKINEVLVKSYKHMYLTADQKYFLKYYENFLK